MWLGAVVFLASAALAPALARALTEPRREAATDELGSQVLPASKSEVAAKGPFGEFRKFLTGETRSVKDLLTGVAVLEPGQEIHPPHDHAEEEFLLVARGSGTWHLAGAESPAREGDLLYVEPWVMHGLKNTGDAPLTFFVVKWNGKGLDAPVKDAGAATKRGGEVRAEGAARDDGHAKTASIRSQILHRADVKPDAENSPIGDVRRYWNHAATRSMQDLVAGVATLNPGQEVHPAHRHAEEEFLYVVSGSGTWHLDGRDFPAAEGDLQYSEPWISHGITNTSTAPLTFFVIKWNPTAVAMPAKPREE